MFQAENTLVLAGEIVDTPIFSHKTHNFSFYKFTLSISRLSGVCDRITVLSDYTLIRDISLNIGTFVLVDGELRSYNNKSGVGNKLIISAFARSIVIIQPENKNELHLCGTICKPPIFRRTPLGREICDLMVAINRHYGRADYLPCIAWGKNAQRLSEFSVGDNIEIFGRIQSREYIKTIEDTSFVRTTYEVSISQVDLL